jgi:hypothetical protein
VQLSGDDPPTWDNASGGGLTRDELNEVVSKSIALFLIVWLDFYWSSLGVSSSWLNSVPNSLHIGGLSEANYLKSMTQVFNMADPAERMIRRLECEANALEDQGYMIRGEKIGEEQFVLRAEKQEKSLFLLVDSSYPNHPPRIYRAEQQRVEEITFEQGSWSPERNLSEVVEALI